MSDKKVSDIIIELKDQVSFLTKLVANQDNNLKLIIRKLNALESRPSPKLSDYYKSHPHQAASPAKPQIPQDPQAGQQASRKFVEGSDAIAMKVRHAEEQNASSAFERAAAEFGVDIDSDRMPIGSNEAARQAVVDSLSEEKQFSGKTRGRRVDRKSKDKPVNVTQLVMGHDGKPLPLATVRVTDRYGQPVKSTRSNTKGRWSIPLNIGEYNVHILRKFNGTDKKPVEVKFAVSVTDNGTGKMEVQSPELES
jgi:hypothetical protein